MPLSSIPYSIKLIKSVDIRINAKILIKTIKIDKNI